jgi:hypothetical protein
MGASLETAFSGVSGELAQRPFTFAWLTNKDMRMLVSDWLIADPDFRVAGRCSESHVYLPSRSD